MLYNFTDFERIPGLFLKKKTLFLSLSTIRNRKQNQELKQGQVNLSRRKVLKRHFDNFFVFILHSLR